MRSVQIFCETLKSRAFGSLEEVLAEYGARLKGYMQAEAGKGLSWVQKDLPLRENRRAFVLDSLLAGDCAERCRYPADGGMKYHVLNFFFPGIATLGDSLAALDKLVFRDQRFSYPEFMAILDRNFDGHESLLLELQNMTRFGNDSAVDNYAVMIAHSFLDALDQLDLEEGWYAVGGFYSLEKDNTSAGEIPATPDGRLAGTPFSENQSPVYGGDRKGITALLNSLAKLPFARCANGGLNITFSQNIPPPILQSLLTTYFEKGGIHAGISVVNREILQDAMARPEKYKSLTVRLYGFSEYFISLPEWQQRAVLNRTAY
jgi:formate C-acetyltransferase